MRILQLPADIANQIAAGEVIERPASIVKELLENSLDAKADQITIEIGYGGLNQVKVSDNGVGIVADDLPLAIAAHATSKITALKDLYAISSMGFRGEALASIASIARVSISSKPALQETGMLLECQNQQYNMTPCARNQGTTIDVRDIFFNAPVRKKFLNSERSEFQAIDLIVKRFALGSPTIAIHLSHNGKSQLQLPAALEENSRLLRMTKLLGKAFVDTSIYLDAEHAGIRLYGWVSGPNFQRSQNDRLWVYINGRMVKDKLINHAIKQAYENLLYPGRNPACLLYLTINPAQVDVNVHPTKHEVRFQQPRLIHDFISSQLRQILNANDAPAAPLALFCSKEKHEFQVRETSAFPIYTAENAPVDKIRHFASEMHGNWIALNQGFAVLMLNTEPYLVAIAQLQKQYLLECLKKASLPLARRPLLVPIYVESPIKPSDAVQRIDKQLLHQIGIDVEWVSDSKLVIRSLPMLTPNLDIKSFLTACFTVETPTVAGLFELFADNQATGSEMINDEQCAEYAAYLKSRVQNTTEICVFAKPLSAKICEDILGIP